METATANKKPTTNEIIEEVFTVASILIKMGREDILEEQILFIEFLNELGLRSVRGERFTKMGFRNMMARLNPKRKEELLKRFNEGFRDLYTTETMQPHRDGSSLIESFLQSY